MGRGIDVGGLRGYARMTLWIWPSVTVLVAAALGTWIASLETGDAPGLFRGDDEAGRTVLTAMVGGLITALSVVFSITIVGLQTVHSQYSPRLLRNFIQDAGAQVTLATFAGSAAFMLAVLRRIPEPGSGEPVPRLGIVLGMVLFLVCIGVVAYYAQHITHSIRVSSAMDRVVSDALRDDKPTLEASRVAGEVPEPPPDSLVVRADAPGYCHDVDLDRLAGLAERHGVTVRVRPMIGDPVAPGTPVAWVWPASGLDGSGQVLGEIVDAVDVSSDRDLRKDVTYALRQLVDVANRAMSPSLNDPYTAVEAIDHLTIMLCELAGKPLGERARLDGSGRVLVWQPGPDFAACVRLACDQIRRYGAKEPAVAVRLLVMLRDVAFNARDDAARGLLLEEVQSVLDAAEAGGGAERDLEVVRAAAATAREWIDGRPVPDDPSFARL